MVKDLCPLKIRKKRGDAKKPHSKNLKIPLQLNDNRLEAIE